MTPIYDIHKTYLDNAENGPFFNETVPERIWPPNQDMWTDFLGFKIASPIGIAAGPLLNAKWINLASHLGFDVLCYKTIRSKEHAGHPLPNMLYVDSNRQLSPQNLPDKLMSANSVPRDIESVAVTNSFGMPSRSPEYLRKDIPLANASLKSGQVMIVSVVGTPGKAGEDIADDFVKTALLAKECGADIIEANFSCPNVTTGEGCLYYDAATVLRIASRIVQTIGDTPLILKVGLFPSQESMSNAFVAAAKAGVRAICGINTISMKVVDPFGKPALGEGRLSSGICGAPIREAAVDFVRKARQINDKEKLGMAIMAVGGAVLPNHFDIFLNEGADIAMTAAGMLWDPYLAINYHRSKKEKTSYAATYSETQ